MIDNLSTLWQVVIVGITQFIFTYYKTMNVNANFQKNRLKLLWTGIIVHITWLISAAIGINAVLNGNVLLVLISIISSVIGADMGLMESINLNKYVRKQK